MLVSEFIAERPSTPEHWLTGLHGLDRAVGGFRRGELWVITGAPGVGKSLLLLQLVFVLAVRHRFAMQYASTSPNDADLIRARLLSLATKRAPSLPDLSVPVDELTPPQLAALDALRTAELDVTVRPGFVLPHWRLDSERKRCFAVDDPECKRGPVLDPVGRGALRSLADSGSIVLTTVPRTHCLEPAELGERLREEWSAVADVIVEIVPRDAARAVLRIWQNRRGPQRDVEMDSQPHLARFLDSTP